MNYAKAADFAALLKSTDNKLISERGSVSIDERTNTLLVQDTAAKLSEIRALVGQLDVPVRQVMIESRIVIANNDFAKDLGVRLRLSGAGTIDHSNVGVFGGGLEGISMHPQSRGHSSRRELATTKTCSSTFRRRWPPAVAVLRTWCWARSERTCCASS